MNETSKRTHGIYCERAEIAMDDLADRGEIFDGVGDPKVQYEIESQIAGGLTCTCVNYGHALRDWAASPE